MTVLLAKRGFTSPGSRFLRDMERLGATDVWDFVNQSYLRAGRVTASGITFARASVGSYLNSNNTMTVFSSGQPRIGGKGILIEASRQNLFLNSAVGTTQSITVTAAAHTLSFFGTGTVTLSGVSTAGPLVGTGEFNRVSLTFTPTAGSLTLTVSGDIKWVNLELGSFPSSWIPSDGTAVTRAADAATVSLSGYDYPLSLYAFGAFASSVSGTGHGMLSVSDGTAAERATLSQDGSSPTRMNAISRKASATEGSVTSAASVSLNVPFAFAARFAVNNVRAALNGTLTTTDTAAANPTTPNQMTFGNAQFASGSNLMFGYLGRAAIFSFSATDAQLEGMTT